MSLHHRLPSLRLALLFALAWAGLAPPARAGDADQYLPADSMLVIKINVRQLLDSRLAQDYWAAGMRWQYRQNVDYDEMQAFYKDIGFDPFKDLDRVILAGSAGDAPRKGLAILRGRFDPAKIRAKVDDLNKSQPDTVKVLQTPDGKGGDFQIYQVFPGSPGSMFIVLPDATTLFVSNDKDVILDALKKGGPQGKADLKDKDLQAVLENLDDKQVFSAAAVGDALELILEQITLPYTHALFRDSIQRIAAFSGGVTLGDDVKCKVEVAVRAKSFAEAQTLYTTTDLSVRLAVAAIALKRDQENPLDELLFDVVQSIKVRCKDRTVFFKGRIDVDEVEDALRKAGLDVERLKKALKQQFEK